MESVLLFFLIALLQVIGTCTLKAKQEYAQMGQMVMLRCNYDGNVIWTTDTTEETILTNMPPDQQRQMGLVIHGRNLVILNVSLSHQGNYSCSMGNASRTFLFRLTIHTTQMSKTCYSHESCKLKCRDPRIPPAMNITMNGTLWNKEDGSLPDSLGDYYYFQRAEDKDRGMYTCTRSYLYQSQKYKMTFTTVLDIKPGQQWKTPAIITPNARDVFYVDFGSMLIIDCKAVMYSPLDLVYWLSGKSFVETNDSLRVYYKNTSNKHNDEIRMTASLVIRKVSEEDLSNVYTCKLESTSISQSSCSCNVTVTLVKKAHPSFFLMALCIVCITLVLGVTLVIYVTLKIDIALFLRDTVAFCRTRSDGKCYDAFLMCYESNTKAGLMEDDRKYLETALEEEFGYNLCIYDRDVLPGKAAAEAMLECIEQSRTVVLVPTYPHPDLESGLLSAIHEALVERKTHLVFIKTTGTPSPGSLPEALQLLLKSGHCVTWKGAVSQPLSSSFWKHLRYHLPAPQSASKKYCYSHQLISK
ncbi:interleukin-18 receptor 1-like [Thalassophryne amazonica]|uniref:interleukin-18 receptor 1-like n=1 Tax=Thalassophryne amazonica TaxID=390379 RepID=UPI0014724004|nr:interleukin-18 receptor 1-like [Thalassophryne amazonica]